MTTTHRPVQHRGRWALLLGPWAGLALLTVLLLPAVRQASESSMTVHMLVQYPALLVAGGLLAGRGSGRVQAALQRWNQLGIAGLSAAAVTMAVLMVPRVLDLALVDAHVEIVKLVALALSGAALRLSWQPAGTVMQAFFLGNVLPMLAVVGTLFEDSPTRLCTAYLLDDQQTLGSALIGVAVGVMVLWLLWLASLHTMRPDHPAPAAPIDGPSSFS